MKNKISLVLVSVYLALFVISVIYVEYIASKTAELSGLLLIVLAMPWVFLFDSHTNNLISIGVPVIINAILLYFVGYLISKTKQK